VIINEYSKIYQTCDLGCSWRRSRRNGDRLFMGRVDNRWCGGQYRMMTSARKPEQKRLGGSARLGADQTESLAKPVAETRNRAQIGRHMLKKTTKLAQER
jgi:hypothetical protein